ncbi:unnamed protein product [Euphydryas editha]|uniref:Uncharacterized protein n=1 Tax=Euphydryas editha TaxID=104508 RepID=A0AAU9UD38_EUPED|nr:unnamed protein product [Euphydryas editha]
MKHRDRPMERLSSSRKKTEMFRTHNNVPHTVFVVTRLANTCVNYVDNGDNRTISRFIGQALSALTNTDLMNSVQEPLICINTTSAAERFDDAEEETTDTFETLTSEDIGFEIASHPYDDPDYKNHVVGCVAGNVERNVIKKIKYKFCVNNMLTEERLWFHKLVTMSDQVALIYVSHDAYVICNTDETYLTLERREQSFDCNLSLNVE